MSGRYVHFVKTLGALGVLVAHLHDTALAASIGDPYLGDQVAAEIRDALELCEARVRQTLQHLAEPVWGELPNDIRAMCEAAAKAAPRTDD